MVFKASSDKPNFGNRPNPKVRLADGKSIWLSRSCAVVAEVFLYSEALKAWYVLLGQRGENVPDFKHCWGMPCGYLDWNESLYDAFLREVWEETSLFLPSLLNSNDYIKSEGIDVLGSTEPPTPLKISESYTGEKQNISFHFCARVYWKSKNLPELSVDNAERGEAVSAHWVAINDALNMSLAFEHSARLKVISQTLTS